MLSSSSGIINSVLIDLGIFDEATGFFSSPKKAFISLILMLVCYFSIPFMNEAKDSGNDTLFIILHAGSMILTLATLIINILFVVFWKY